MSHNEEQAGPAAPKRVVPNAEKSSPVRSLASGRATLVAILAMLPLLLGYSCGPAAGPGAGPQGPIAHVFFDFDFWAVEQGIPVQVLVRVNTDHEFQSFEIGIQGQPETLLLHSALPSETFDDNGTLFVPPKYNITTGEIQRIVDFRHGGIGTKGSVAIAEFTLYPHTASETASLTFTKVSIANAAGEELVPVPQNMIFAIDD